MPRSSPASIYSVHPAVAMTQDWIASLKAKTGRSLDEWLRLIGKEGPSGEAERRAWLKEVHGLGTNTAAWMAERSVGKASEDEDPRAYLRTAARYVEDMYTARPTLRPLHDRLIDTARRLLPQVRICPCKTIVPLFRDHVIAQIKPATKTRIDFGLALGALMKQGPFKAPARLLDTGGFQKKDRITHRIAVTSAADIDAELEQWLQRAWDLDQPA